LEENKKSSYGFWFWVAIILGTVGLFSPLLFKVFLNEHQYDNLSKIGDWWGGTSAAFIALSGIILLVLNYLSQKKELEETRKEFKIQNETLKIQRFENTFFHLISLYNNVVNSLYYDDKTPKPSFILDNNTASGKDFFSMSYHWLKNWMDPSLKGAYKDEFEFVKATYNSFYREKRNYYEHYFNTISEILNYVAISKDINFDQKKFYINIFKSQLSNFELLFLFYHGISNYNDEIKDPLEKFEMLKNIDISRIFQLEHLKFYNQYKT
jgi:hypothetical protein